MEARPMHVLRWLGISPPSFHHPLSFWQAAHAADTRSSGIICHTRDVRSMTTHAIIVNLSATDRSCAIFWIFCGSVNDSVLSSHHASSYCPPSNILKPQETKNIVTVFTSWPTLIVCVPRVDSHFSALNYFSRTTLNFYNFNLWKIIPFSSFYKVRMFGFKNLFFKLNLREDRKIRKHVTVEKNIRTSAHAW